jgi:hypothetical protein
MDKTIRDKLLSCKSYAEAKPILETSHAGVAVHKLFSTGFGVQAKQPTVAQDFFYTGIQEMEDEEEKIKEVDGGKSEQSSSTTGLDKVGSESDAAESFHAQADKKDQMGVAINEAFPPQGGMPPQPGMPPMQPQQQMGQQPCGQQQPPMNPQQQMQYTINETTRNDIAQIKEAIKSMDRKIQETIRTQPSSLEVGSETGHKSVAMIRETSDAPAINLQKARQDITKMNDFINLNK